MMIFFFYRGVDVADNVGIPVSKLVYSVSLSDETRLSLSYNE